MKRRDFVTILGGAAVAWPLAARAQQPAKLPRVGFLSAGTPTGTARQLDMLRQGLRELGWIVGKNIAIEARYAEGKHERLPDLAADLVRIKVDVIVAAAIEARQAAKSATATIPIVMAQSGDPVAEGFVASLARPGGNITGLTTLAADASGKRLQLLKEAIPAASRVAVLWIPSNAINALIWKETQTAARSARLVLQSAELQGVDDIDNALSAVTKGRSNALIVIRSPITRIHARRIIDFAARNQLPTMFDDSLYVADGGLMSYGTDILELFRRAATYVDKILKGAKPGDLPIEQPTRFELVINRKTAKALGITISQQVLLRADRVIE